MRQDSSEVPAPAVLQAPVWRRIPRPVAATAAGLAALLLAWQLFASFGFEPLLRWAVPRAFAERGGLQLTLATARLDPWRLAVEVDGLALRDAQGRPLLDLPVLAVDLEAGASVLRRALVLASLRLERPVLWVERGTDGKLPWVDTLGDLAGPPDPGADPDAPPPRLLLQRFELVDGAVDWHDRALPDGFRSRVDALVLMLEGLSTLPEDRGSHTLSASLGHGTTLRWKGGFALHPLAADGELAIDGLPLAPLWPYLRQSLDIAPPGGTLRAALAYRVSGVAGEPGRPPTLQLERVEARLTGLTLQGAGAAAPSVVLDTVSVSGGRFDLASRELVVDEVAAEGGRVVARLDAEGRLDLQRWLRSAPAPVEQAASAAADSSGSPAAPWRLTLAKVGVASVAVQVEERGFATPWQVGSEALSLGFAARVHGGAGATAVEVDDLQVALKALTLTEAGAPAPWFTLGSLALDGGRVSLTDRELALGRLVLADGRLAVSRDAQGRVSLVETLRRSAPSGRGRADTGARASTAASPWRWSLAGAQATGLAVDLVDSSVSPPAQLQVTDLQAAAESLSGDLSRPLPVSMRLALASGGSLQARGRVVPGLPSADLEFTLEDLALEPAAPYVARFSTARLAGGRVETQGRVQASAESWRFDGRVAVQGLAFDEAGSGERLLGWRRLVAPAVAVTSRSARIGEVSVDGLAAKVVVSQDRQLNLAQVVPREPATSTPSAAANASPYLIEVDRVRIVDGGVDFADLSLALPFGARIRELNGAVVGLRSVGDAVAEVELEGRVDEYGLARVTGQLRPSDPAALMDLAVVFRNVEMPTLTPYSATFAGRRIASGRLSLDLQYTLRDRQMAGDNRIVMDRLELGERVENPAALNLPLDLAVALLQDADGRIDLGLPVSGSLDDPKFSVGQIVWKAIVNLLTRIVTAPFRALAGLIGSGDQPLDRIVFDPGATKLLPPEKEKLDKLAGALAKRPGLAIRIQGGVAPAPDAAALRERALRRAVAARAGRPPAEGEDPGPIGLSDPAIGRALQTLFTQRFGADALALARQQVADAAVAGASSASKGAADVADRLPALLRQRLLASEVVGDAQLQALARQRAERIREALRVQGVAPQRLAVGDMVEQTGERDGVPSVLALDAAAPAASQPLKGP